MFYIDKFVRHWQTLLLLWIGATALAICTAEESSPNGLVDLIAVCQGVTFVTFIALWQITSSNCIQLCLRLGNLWFSERRTFSSDFRNWSETTLLVILRWGMSIAWCQSRIETFDRLVLFDVYSKVYDFEVDGKQHRILTHTPVCSECKSLHI
jgi:hypothetical protein